ncbi:hypothetical protein QFC21_006215 [Naganishia friedmannii]|uniref:Uncharacterized protein n=1 Tax=Naganishia friedmannii TaxID=89922 RepID=A0ACC2V3S2_9TREE|nr:hypothetical protein QFC21_006215 [Naganishia friedmannii]
MRQMLGSDGEWKGNLIVLVRHTLPFLPRCSNGGTLLFGIAKEQHSVRHPSYAIELVTIRFGDDVALSPQDAVVRRRGRGGTSLVYKCTATLTGEVQDVVGCRDVADDVGALERVPNLLLPVPTVALSLHCFWFRGALQQHEYRPAPPPPPPPHSPPPVAKTPPFL